MRIDKFLWCVRFYKTRAKASEACRKGQIKIEGIVVKPSRLAYTGELYTLRKNQINHTFEILQIPKSRIGAKLLDVHIIDRTDPAEFEKLELLKYSKDHYRKKSEGRPTKKDRRDIEGYTDD